MTIRIEQVRDDWEGYERFLTTRAQTLLYASARYLCLLEHLLRGERFYLQALDGEGRRLGVLPVMVSASGPEGPVANSLPYFGSNGGVLLRPGLAAAEQEAVQRALLAEAMGQLQDQGCAAFSLTASPFEPAPPAAYASSAFDYHELRVGQVSFLPAPGTSGEARLTQQFHASRMRNLRKARKEGVRWYVAHDLDALRFLHEVHRQNMEAIGGQAKSLAFFESIPRFFQSSDYAVYVAEREGRRVAALLLFYYQTYVEYFTPATAVAARSYQPSALLIFEAMKAAMQHGYRIWNWGGTWPSQHGVYAFKQRWGAEDRPYVRLTRLFKPELRSYTPEELAKAYPGFFVVPYAQLPPTPSEV